MDGGCTPYFCIIVFFKTHHRGLFAGTGVFGGGQGGKDSDQIMHAYMYSVHIQVIRATYLYCTSSILRVVKVWLFFIIFYFLKKHTRCQVKSRFNGDDPARDMYGTRSTGAVSIAHGSLFL